MAIAGIVIGSIFTLVLLIALVASTTSPDKLDSADAERKMTRQFTAQLGQAVTVDCPEDISVGTGKITNCTVRTASGEARLVRLTQDDAEGNFTFQLTGQAP